MRLSVGVLCWRRCVCLSVCCFCVCLSVRVCVGVVVEYYAESQLLATLRSRLRQSLLLWLLAQSAFWTLLLLLLLLLLVLLLQLLLLLRLLRLLWLLLLLPSSRTQFLKKNEKNRFTQ